MWDAVDPFARTLLSGRGSSTLSALGGEILSALSVLARLPRRIDSTLTRLDQGLLAVRMPELENTLKRLDRTTRRVPVAILAATLILGGIALRISGDELGNGLLVAGVPLVLYALGLLRLP